MGQRYFKTMAEHFIIKGAETISSNKQQKRPKLLIRKIAPVLLAIMFCCISVLSLSTIIRMQGNARVINYTGIVRGATQRLIKQEMYGIPNDDLIAYLDGILTELSTGEGVNDLIVLKDDDFQDLMKKMGVTWNEIKAEIEVVRKSGDYHLLFSKSEDYFVLADRAVSAAECYSERGVQSAKVALIILSAGLFWQCSGCLTAAKSRFKWHWISLKVRAGQRVSFYQGCPMKSAPQSMESWG